MKSTYADTPEIDFSLLKKTIKEIVGKSTLHLTIYFFLSIISGLFAWLTSSSSSSRSWIKIVNKHQQTSKSFLLKSMIFSEVIVNL